MFLEVVIQAALVLEKEKMSFYVLRYETKYLPAFQQLSQEFEFDHFVAKMSEQFVSEF